MSSSIARYESFLLNNVSTISTLESSLRSLTWFLPGRFKDAELASEARMFSDAHCSVEFCNNPSLPAVSALLNILSLYHDTLLARITRSDPKYQPLIPPSLHTRFTSAWSDQNTRYKWTARMLELLRFTELLVEMGLRRKASGKTRWRVIVLIETIKCALFPLCLLSAHHA
jgi:peroxin-16